MAGFKITLEGDARLIRSLEALGPRARAAGKEALQLGVDAVVRRAKEGIANGPKTGRLYTERYLTGPNGGIFPSEKRTPHRASAVGEYPAADTGNLMRLIYGEVDDKLASLESADLGTQLSLGLGGAEVAETSIAGTVHADADYAGPLEYKAPWRGGRPFLRRALGESEDEINAYFVAALARLV